MSNHNNKKIAFASILGAILSTGLLALNPSLVTDAGAQLYGDQYGYDKHPKKSSHGDIQKIKCVNSNINVNGIDITQIPQDGPGVAATNEGGVEGANTQNGKGLADRINFDRNLVNICVNVNDNEQVKVSAPTCEGCFSILDDETIGNVLDTIDSILNSMQIDVQINTLEDLCEFLETSTAISSEEKWRLLNTALGSESLPRGIIDNILQCLEDLGIIVEPA